MLYKEGVIHLTLLIAILEHVTTKPFKSGFRKLFEAIENFLKITHLPFTNIIEKTKRQPHVNFFKVTI